MKKRNLVFMTTIATLLIFWTACNKKEQAVAPPVPGNEFLTTVELVATNAADPTDTQTAKWVKLNPDDTSAPDISHAKLNLKKNANYNVQVKFLDETKTPAEDITSEIQDRENYHLVCFTIAAGLNLTVTRTDHDTNNPPLEVGLQDLFAAGAASSGNLEVVLHHQPNVKNGDCAPGSIDADVNYTVNIN
jgi:hypothetical protein